MEDCAHSSLIEAIKNLLHEIIQMVIIYEVCFSANESS